MSKYETHVEPYLDKIAYWRKDGLTEEQIAKDKLHIAYSTLNLYKKQKSELSEALKDGKDDLIRELKESLYKRAMGHEVEETKTYIEKDDSGKEKKKVEKTKRMIHSDTCLIFALKNLDPENFKDRRELKQEVNQTIRTLGFDLVDENGNVIDLKEGVADVDL
jgi:hypothetical protein